MSSLQHWWKWALAKYDASDVSVMFSIILINNLENTYHLLLKLLFTLITIISAYCIRRSIEDSFFKNIWEIIVE